MREIDRLITTSQAAEMLGITNKALLMRMRRGKLSGTKRGRLGYLFRIADIVEILDSSVEVLVEDIIPTFSTAELNRLITRPQAAEMLNMDPATLWERTDAGIPPRPAGKVGNKIMYRVGDVVGAIDNPYRPGEYEKPRKAPVLTYMSRKGKKGGDNTFDAVKYETIRARCPTCSDRFLIEVPVGSSGWIYCKKHRDSRHRSPEAFATGYNLNYF